MPGLLNFTLLLYLFILFQCGHCISLQPEWEKLPDLMKEKVKIAKIDATVNRNMASKY